MDEMKSLPEYASLEDIRNNFSIPELVTAAKENNLAEWLASNFLLGQGQKLLDLVENDANDDEIFALLCRIFNVSFDDLSNEEAAKISHSLDTIRLRLANKAVVAESQPELARAIWSGADTIILKGENEFSLPLGVPNKRFIGDGNTIIEIFYDENVDFDAKGIVVENAQIFLRSQINFKADNSKNLKVICGNKKLLDGNDLSNVFQVLKGRSPFESADAYRARAENIKGVAVGYALLNCGNFNFDQQNFDIVPTWDFKFIDVLKNYVSGKKFRIKVAPDAAERLYNNERKLQIFADFSYTDQLTISALYLETANAGRIYLEF